MNEPHCKVKDEANRPLSLEIWTDLGYVCAVKEATEYWACFNIYQISGTYPDGSPVLNGCQNIVETQNTDYLDEAEVFLDAHVKWDGCSNWAFHPADNCCLHFCTQQDAANLGVLLSRIYDKAKELMGRDELG